MPSALGELRHGLRDALLLELQPGEAFMQESSVVLLAGKLLVTGKADSVPLQQHAGQLSRQEKKNYTVRHHNGSL